MFRYRCPHCTKLLQAPEIRAGKTTVCSKCSQPLTIPGDKSEWLNERGEPLLTSPTVVIKSSMLLGDFVPPPPRPAPKVESDADNDVLGAIFTGAINPLDEPASADFDLDVSTPAGLSSALNALLGGSDSGLGPTANPVPVPATPAPVAERSSDTPAPAAALQFPAATPAPAPTTAPDEVEIGSPVALQVEDEPPARKPEPVTDPIPAKAPEPAAPAPAAAMPGPEVPTPAPVSGRPSIPVPPRSVPRPAPPPIERTPEPVHPQVPAAVVPAAPEPAAQPGRVRRTLSQVIRMGSRPPAAAGPAPFGPQAPTAPAVVSPDPTRADVSSSQGAPRSRRMVPVTPAAPRRTDVATVSFDDTYRLRHQADIAADLTAALTSRMKPPPRPPRDLRLSTALWLVTTGIAVALLLTTLFTADGYATAAMVLGAVQVALGYGWIVWLAARRDWQRGLVCAVPPLTLWYLGQWKYAKFRPLRFVATGAVLVGLAAVTTQVQQRTRALAGVADPAAVPAAEPDITTRPKLVQLRQYRDQRQYEALIRLLRDLARTDPTYSGEAKDRAELKAELKAQCEHADSGVKIEAMAAYATWGGDDARGMCLNAVRSPSQEERVMALRLLPRWKDARVAEAIASRIGRPGTETTVAQEALIELGGPAAERAVLPFLQERYDQNVRLLAIDILTHEKVGGKEAVDALRDTARTTSDPAVRYPATARAALIEERLRK